MLNCAELTNIFGGSNMSGTQSRISPNQKLTLTWGGHARQCEGTGWDKGWLGTISGDRSHTLAFPAAEKSEVKGLKGQQKEPSDTSSEKLIMQIIPITCRPLQAQTPYQSMLCAPESRGHKERDRAAQVRGGMAQCLIWSCVHNHHLRLITLLSAVQKSFLPVLQEAQHWFLPFLPYRESVKPPLCQKSQAEFTHCKLPVPHRT